MTPPAYRRPATAVLELVGHAPLVLEDATFTEAAVLPDGSHRAQVTGWTDPRTVLPTGPQVLLCARLPHRRAFAVAHVQVRVTVPYGGRVDVAVEWTAGMEFPPPDPALDPAAAARSLAEHTMRAPVAVLADRIVRRAAVVARSGAVEDEVRELAEDCRNLARSDPRTPPCHVPDTDHPDPALLLQQVSAEWHTTVISAGVLRLYLRPYTNRAGDTATALAALGLSTLPRPLPADPAAPVLLYCANAPAAGLLGAAAQATVPGDAPAVAGGTRRRLRRQRGD